MSWSATVFRQETKKDDMNKSKLKILNKMARLAFAGLLMAPLVAVHAAGPLAVDAKSKPATKPNILLILTDDQGYGDLRSTGNDQIDTPTLDRLASEGARFSNFHVSPVCAPTRAALLTGRYPSRCGVYFTVGGAEIMRLKEVTIAQMLKANGYDTGIFGKWHNGEVYPYTPKGKEFDEFLGFHGGGINLNFDPILEHNGKTVACSGYTTDVFTDAAMQFMAAHREGPFFCYVPYNTPHYPLQAPKKYLDKHQKTGGEGHANLVYAMVENIDDNVARLLAKLDELKIADNTIVIFLSDNGPSAVRFNCGMLGTKGGIDEGSTRVPCFVRWPGRIKPGTVVQPLAAHIDILPTIAEACGVKTPEGVKLDGCSLMPLLTGAKEPWPARTFFTEIGAARTDRWRIVFRDAKGIQQANWLEWLDRSKTELFDMIADPGQARDVAAEHPDVVKQLTEEFKAWKTDVGPPLDVPPLPVGYEEAPITRLRTAMAKVKGVKERMSYHHLEAWTDTQGSVEWNLDVIKEGEYEARLVYVCPPEDLGAQVKLEACGRSITSRIDHPVDPAFQKTPPYAHAEVHIWGTCPLGTLKLDRGLARLRMTVPEIPNKRAFVMLGVELERKDRSGKHTRLEHSNADWGTLAIQVSD